MESGLYLFDNQLKLKRTIQPKKLIENSQEMELNGVITARASMKYEKDIETYSYFGQKERNNFWLYKIKNIHKEDNKIELSGIHIFYDDLKGCIIRDIRPKNQTAINAFNQILQGTGWVVSLSTAQKTTSANFYYKSVLTAFNEALKIWNCEFIPKINFVSGVITSKSIELHDRISKDYGKWFEYGDKLVSIVAETDADIYTAYIGLGKGEQTENGGFGRKLKFDSIAWSVHGGKPADKPLGQDYIEIKEATKKWGYPDGRPKIGIVEFSEIEDKEELIQSTYKYALENCRPKVQLKSKTINFEKVELGEICTVIRSNMNIRYKTRIFKIKKDFLNPGLIDFEFGDKVSISVSDRVKDEKEKELKKDLEVRSKFEKVLDEITKSYFNDDGYNYELKSGNKYNLPAGYYSFDKPIDENPTKVVYMGAGKVLIANEKKPNGEWNWKTAMTSEGIVGGEIVSNSITANKLAADVGQSLDLSSNNSINNLVNNSVTKEIDKIEIGARNLAKNSQSPNINYWKKWAAKSLKIEEIKDNQKVEWNGIQCVEFVSLNEEINNKLVGYYRLNSNPDIPNFENKKNYTISFDVINLSAVNVKIYLSGFNSITKVALAANESKRISITAEKGDKPQSQIAIEVEEIGQEPKLAIKFLKIEIGTKATTWTPAIEDLEEVDTKIKSVIEYLASDNKDLLKKIENLNVENAKIRHELSTSLKQTKDEFTFIFNNYKQIIDENNQTIDEKFNDISRYIRFKGGNIELGDNNSPFKALLTHEKISFLKNGVEVAYMSNNKLYIVQAEILVSIRIGKFEFVPRQNGNLSIRKVVE